MKLKFTSQHLLMFAWLFLGTVAHTQQLSPLDIANEHIRTHLSEWGYTPQDMDGMTVNDMYTDNETGITRIFFLQHFQGIPVYNAILTINVDKKGKVFFVSKMFVQDLASKVNTTVPVVTSSQAVHQLAAHYGIAANGLRLKETISSTSFKFDKGDFAREDIPVKLNFQPYQNKVLLSWDIVLAPVGTYDLWNSRVDAVTGSVLDEYNWTVYCKVDGSAYTRGQNDCHEEHDVNTFEAPSAMMAGSYNVWPAPYESPNHGPRTLVTDPNDLIASPFGWHDTNGAAGPEYTITRGNNVHAYQDRMSSGSSNDEPDGGPSLVFDFPYSPTAEPEAIIDAAVTNLFYWNNFMHDFSYRYGFNEAAGNFQQNNYGNGGAGGDYVIAHAQAGAGLAPPSLNNANFSTPGDGQSGTMNMFIWQGSGANYVTAVEPASVAGQYGTILPTDGDWGTQGGPSGNGAYVTDVPVTAEAIFVDDGSGNPTDGCQNLINSADVAGKIALIDRGSCEFGSKALRAQQAGAVGVIICQIAGGTALGGMSPGVDGGQVTIPTVFISLEDCQVLRQFEGNGLKITLVNPGQAVPISLDGDLDNGIIAHEYGHGISTRLTGGPGTSCLNNAEQMGEGWSDFFALVTSVRPGDSGEMARGVGTFALRQNTNGLGIRRFPYSTDMSVNPLTYGGVASNTEVHDLGEYWTAMLWDMYWNFVDEYGWSADNYDQNSGNYKAVRLVYEGLKTQGCNPGFLTGRDAILAADETIFDGANRCLIWKAFARRGAGENASQGSTSDATDQVEDFTLPCDCRNALTITKKVTDFINAGEEINVEIHVSNCKVDAVTNVLVSDIIPNGCTFKAGSSSIPANVQGDVVTFGLGSLPFGQEVTITYTMTTSPDKYSVRRFFDSVPNDVNTLNWLPSFDPDGAVESSWNVIDAFGGYTGSFAWFAQDIEAESDAFLDMDESEVFLSINGNRPTLRFYHRYDTEGSADGGFVMVKNINEADWEFTNDKMLRNGYPAVLQYGTLALPNIASFTGNSGAEFKASYMDLSEWAGQDVHVRFRFATDDNTAVVNGGWLLDDIEYMNLFAYNSQACVTTDQGDNICVEAPDQGTIVESKDGPSSATEQLSDLTATVYPNPATDMVTIALSTDRQQEVNISFLSLDGRQMFGKKFNILGKDYVNVNTSNVPAGFYFVKISTEDGQLVQKVIIE
ncbi:MAG: M36 family metallopeptidase [Lewinellaceae bacterium]|nr:M36 family metallopeptidase [Saprospiraceae bacterium]MCB9336672.1 M36 family metallopeptidase [Lewinellaceae bacterium]